ncbi:hypothetical protein BpHYR1_043321 [Brachionus plicatilis]|uniref:Uncharacterized protein n=1 Tax=Brachionus plicatilis TaxID=10195 RepID=A0A3M7QHS8_BRAPC|nr:hypothetical protein BpHYR1_043321 [Brachionus plicatilis]
MSCDFIKELFKSHNPSPGFKILNTEEEFPDLVFEKRKSGPLIENGVSVWNLSNSINKMDTCPRYNFPVLTCLDLMRTTSPSKDLIAIINSFLSSNLTV